MSQQFPPETSERIRKGDTRAFESVYIALYESLYQYAYSFLHSRESSEDAVQEVFRRIWEKRTDIPETHEIRPYLFAAVRNRVYKQWKHERIVAESIVKFDDDIPAMGSSSGDPEISLHQTDIRAALEHAISNIPENRREIIFLRWNMGMSYPEIATTLGISVEAAQTQVSRLQRALRPLLKGLLE